MDDRFVFEKIRDEVAALRTEIAGLTEALRAQRESTPVPGFGVGAVIDMYCGGCEWKGATVMALSEGGFWLGDTGQPTHFYPYAKTRIVIRKAAPSEEEVREAEMERLRPLIDKPERCFVVAVDTETALAWAREHLWTGTGRRRTLPATEVIRLRGVSFKDAKVFFVPGWRKNPEAEDIIRALVAGGWNVSEADVAAADAAGTAAKPSIDRPACPQCGVTVHVTRVVSAGYWICQGCGHRFPWVSGEANRAALIQTTGGGQP